MLFSCTKRSICTTLFLFNFFCYAEQEIKFNYEEKWREVRFFILRNIIWPGSCNSFKSTFWRNASLKWCLEIYFYILQAHCFKGLQVESEDMLFSNYTHSDTTPAHATFTPGVARTRFAGMMMAALEILIKI